MKWERRETGCKDFGVKKLGEEVSDEKGTLELE